MITDAQVKRFRKKRKTGLNQEAAAAAAGMSVKTGRKYEKGAMPSAVRVPHTWRTRDDPLADVWEAQVVPLLQADEDGGLLATTILDELAVRCPGTCGPEHLRTLQRRVRHWRALHGPAREVFFPQVHPPGRESQVDFTHGTELQVTIRGVALEHLWFELILSCSGHRYVELAFGETYQALTQGIQNGFWEFGGTTEYVRSDNLSAATHQLKLEGGRGLTPRFREFLTHFEVQSTRIQAGRSHENGVVEKAHDILKTAIDQALRLRGSRDFPSLDEYVAYVGVVVGRLNARCRKEFEQERPHLRPLPAARFPCYTEVWTKVSRWSVIRVGGNTYSVHSRLIGHEVAVRVHADTVEVRYGNQLVSSGPRLRGEGKLHIDYRHLSHSLVRKPGAFARYLYREALFPTVAFRRAYDALCEHRGSRAEVEYVRILHLAATTMEVEVEAALERLLEAKKPFDFAEVRGLVQPRLHPEVPDLVATPAPPSTEFDQLLSGECYGNLTQRRPTESHPCGAAA